MSWRFGKDPLLWYWQSFACPHGKVLRDLTRHKHGQAVCSITLVRRRQTTASFNPLANLTLAVTKLVFTLPPSYARKAVLPQHAPVTSPEQRDPENHLSPVPAPEWSRAALEEALCCRDPCCFSTILPIQRGNSLFSLGKFCRTFP